MRPCVLLRRRRQQSYLPAVLAHSLGYASLARLGLGVSGYLETTEEQKQWLPEAALWLDHFDVDYSKQHGWPVSIKLRTVK